MIRYVIVAQMTPQAHVPDVFGTWETEDAAKAQMEAWERRIARTYGTEDYNGIHMSVEPMTGKLARQFEGYFKHRTGLELAQ